MDYKSVFDIIGPVMVGPSSSHTAGACRIGKIAHVLFDDIPETVNCYLYESFAKTYRGHGTDVAICGGVLGMEPDDPHLHESLVMAVEKGMTMRFIPLSDPSQHPNTAKLVMRKGDRKMVVVGESIGGGSVRITEIDGIKVDVMGGIDTLVVFHHDKNGMIAKVSTILSKYDLNIASMKVDREFRGKNAYMIITVDEPICKEAIDAIFSLENIIDVKYIRK